MESVRIHIQALLIQEKNEMLQKKLFCISVTKATCYVTVHFSDEKKLNEGHQVLCTKKYASITKSPKDL